MADKIKTLTELIDRDGIVISAIQHDGMRRTDNWTHFAMSLVLRREGKPAGMEVSWRQGTDVTDDPTAADVMSSLVMKAQSYENSDDDSMDTLDRFANWCEEYGVDAFSANVQTFRAVEKETAKLEAFLGYAYPEYLLCEVDV